MNVAKSSFTELPTIDISDLASGSLAKRQAVADTIGKAARGSRLFLHHRPRHCPRADRRDPHGGKTALRPADGAKDGVLHRPLPQP
ncbi:Uncharacterised protein [Raoultella terrigena]|uniref:Uncharacterized protein n=1 Tax=Raoultella terrigena TaxID=577 RepID=A0A3P8KTY1_RAOTE|nr:Uncharacterised protein [Raoultella terrigena]